MTLDAKGTKMTLTGPACCLPREVNDRDFVSVGLRRGYNAGNTSAWLFGSTLALHSVEFWAVQIVAGTLQ